MLLKGYIIDNFDGGFKFFHPEGETYYSLLRTIWIRKYEQDKYVPFVAGQDAIPDGSIGNIEFDDSTCRITVEDAFIEDLDLWERYEDCFEEIENPESGDYHMDMGNADTAFLTDEGKGFTVDTDSISLVVNGKVMQISPDTYNIPRGQLVHIDIDSHGTVVIYEEAVHQFAKSNTDSSVCHEVAMRLFGSATEASLGVVNLMMHIRNSSPDFNSVGDFDRYISAKLCHFSETLRQPSGNSLVDAMDKRDFNFLCTALFGSELTAFVSVNTPITDVMWDPDLKRYIPYSYNINLYEDYMRNCAPFDSVGYLLSYYGAKFSMLPPASVTHCKSQADCDELIDSLKGIIWG